MFGIIENEPSSQTAIGSNGWILNFIVQQALEIHYERSNMMSKLDRFLLIGIFVFALTVLTFESNASTPAAAKSLQDAKIIHVDSE